MADEYPIIKKLLSDLTLGHTEVANEINYRCRTGIIYPLDKQQFTTTEASVRRWRRATMSALDGSEINADETESTEGGPVKGSPLNPLEAISEPPDMKVLFLDIEMAPIKAYVWDTWKVDIPADMIIEPRYMLCFAAKWLKTDETIFRNINDHDMHDILWSLLSEADVVIHYNGKKFDIPRINTEFILAGYEPYSPVKQVDLYQVVKSVAAFEKNSLDYVSKVLGASGKKQTGGFSLWIGCMNNDPVAWKKMQEYNIQDIITLEDCYYLILPWISNHPSFAAFSGTFRCPNCGSQLLEKRGYYYTSVSKYQRFRCACGTYSRDTKRISGAPVTGVAL
jgi:DNA polymerase elongation subunit (family B)